MPSEFSPDEIDNLIFGLSMNINGFCSIVLLSIIFLSNYRCRNRFIFEKSDDPSFRIVPLDGEYRHRTTKRKAQVLIDLDPSYIRVNPFDRSLVSCINRRVGIMAIAIRDSPESDRRSGFQWQCYDITYFDFPSKYP